MRTYRPGLWFLAGGLAATLCIWVVSTSFAQLAKTGEIDFASMTYFQVMGYGDIAATLALVTGAVLCALGSPSGQRRYLFVTIAVLFAVHRLLYLAPWLLSQLGVEVSMALHLQLMLTLSALYIAAFAALALIAQAGMGSKRLAKYTQIVVAIRACWFFFSNMHRGGGAVDWTSVIGRMLALSMLLGGIALVFDMLGAFAGSEQRPDARIRDKTRGIATFIAIGAAFLGIALAALAVWGTKRTSSVDATSVTMIEGTLIFMSAAIALRALQRRELHLERFAAATLVVIVAGRVVLGVYAGPAQDVDLEEHALPGLSIELPEGDTDVKYSYIELGKLVVTSRHVDLGLVELSWAPQDEDPISELRRAGGEGELIPFENHTPDAQVNGVVWSYPNEAKAFASWQCPGSHHWYLLEVSRYSPGVDVIRKVASRVIETIRCRSLAIADAFKMPAPSGFSSLWAPQLDSGDVIARAGITDGNASASKVSARPIPQGIIEDEERTIIEQHDDTAYRIAAVWHCYTMNIDVAIYAVAPPNRSRESLLTAIGSAHCPR